ncbi:hypothetical protein KC327_g2803 [Hortaea werneckii]|nr:hypothetical protein KC350_g756 [Hortaea werneckii]KAI7049933.1 hypothetical protein KC366_g1375 [Hortaea werneckii]KAI7077469.1 hypothetical protein KC327_g2803 [Hortaea werneckii]KAI7501707.1 hypothetical protein KC364_g1077 [Hortaea werneckii]
MVPWNENQRTTTYLLFKDAEFADLPLPDKVRIFNHLHSDERGENITVKKLSEAFSRRSDDRAAKGWAVVRNTDHPNDEEIERRTVFKQGVRQSIRDAAVTLGIEDGDIVVVESIEKGESSRLAESQPAGSQKQLSTVATTASGSTTGVKRKTTPTTTERDVSPVASSSSRPQTTHQAPQPRSERRVPPIPAAPIDHRANTIPSVVNVRRNYNGDGPLPMMHCSDIVWNGSTGKAKESRAVQDYSQIYYLGGPMHEILVPSVDLGNQTRGDIVAHVMICRRKFCVHCSSLRRSSDPGHERARHRERNTDLLRGLPFVHSSDCDIQTPEEAQRNPDASADESGRKPRLMRFRGASKGYLRYIPEKLFSCLVVYNSGDGIMSVAKVMMCQAMYCQQCSGTAMAEEALERDRNLVEGRGWWSEESDDADEHVGKKTKPDAD